MCEFLPSRIRNVSYQQFLDPVDRIFSNPNLNDARVECWFESPQFDRRVEAGSGSTISVLGREFQNDPAAGHRIETRRKRDKKRLLDRSFDSKCDQFECAVGFSGDVLAAQEQLEVAKILAVQKRRYLRGQPAMQHESGSGFIGLHVGAVDEQNIAALRKVLS